MTLSSRRIACANFSRSHRSKGHMTTVFRAYELLSSSELFAEPAASLLSAPRNEALRVEDSGPLTSTNRPLRQRTHSGLRG